MRIISIYFFALYLFPYLGISSAGDVYHMDLKVYVKFGYSYDELNITAIPGSNVDSGSFDSTLKELMKVTETAKSAKEKFEGAVVEIANAVFSEIAGPLSFILPVLQSLLNEEDDHLQKIQKNLNKAIEESYQRTQFFRASDLLRGVNRDVKRFRMVFDTLEELFSEKDRNENITDLKNMIGTSIVSIIQSDIEEKVMEMSEGDSIFWKYPEMAAPSLLALSAFIAAFAPIRDIIDGYLIDNSIISCIMVENINAYFPSILYWRMKKVVTTTEMTEQDYYPYEFTFKNRYSTEKVLSRYDESLQRKTVRCVKNTWSKMIFKDEVTGEEFGLGERAGFIDCYIDYLAMVRWKTESLFNEAKTLMEETCSDKKKNRKRTPTGECRIVQF